MRPAASLASAMISSPSPARTKAHARKGSTGTSTNFSATCGSRRTVRGKRDDHETFDDNLRGDQRIDVCMHGHQLVHHLRVGEKCEKPFPTAHPRHQAHQLEREKKRMTLLNAVLGENLDDLHCQELLN